MNPTFLLSDEGHPRLLFFMSVLFPSSTTPHSPRLSRLETFNTVILHNLSENQNLIYGLLTAHKSFEDLGTFTLARGLRDIKRIQLVKEEQLRMAEGNFKGKNSHSGDPPGEDGELHYEKARLLENEGFGAIERSESTDSIGDHPLRQIGDVPSVASSAAWHSPRAAGTSEKSRGKMKERGSISLDATGSLDLAAAAGVGRNGFVPTQEWVRQPNSTGMPALTPNLTCR
jgi:hypothetical protein